MGSTGLIQLPIPAQIAADAGARVVELGMEREFHEMLGYTQKAVLRLRSIAVTLYHDPDEPGQPRVLITAYRAGPELEDDRTEADWSAWQVRTFPPHVCRWFSFDTAAGHDGR